MMENDPEADCRADGHEAVRHDEHPVVHERAVDAESHRGGHLADEQPWRHAFARSRAPLPMDLRPDREEQDQRAQPADRVCHRVGSAEARIVRAGRRRSNTERDPSAAVATERSVAGSAASCARAKARPSGLVVLGELARRHRERLPADARPELDPLVCEIAPYRRELPPMLTRPCLSAAACLRPAFRRVLHQRLVSKRGGGRASMADVPPAPCTAGGTSATGRSRCCGDAHAPSMCRAQNASKSMPASPMPCDGHSASHFV